MIVKGYTYPVHRKKPHKYLLNKKLFNFTIFMLRKLKITTILKYRFSADWQKFANTLYCQGCRERVTLIKNQREYKLI